jgi:hypothetical protein
MFNAWDITFLFVEFFWKFKTASPGSKSVAFGGLAEYAGSVIPSSGGKVIRDIAGGDRPRKER